MADPTGDFSNVVDLTGLQNKIPWFIRQAVASGKGGDALPQMGPNPPDAPTQQDMVASGDAPDLTIGQQQPQQQPFNPMQGANEIASTMQNGQAPKLAGETKGHKLLRILMGGAYGAAAGAGQRTFGEGFQQAQTLPLALQHQQLQNQATAQTLPFLRSSKIAEINKNLAEAGKAQAEAGAIPAKTALEQAQAEAEPWKTAADGSLINVVTGQKYEGQTAPLTPEEAQVLGKQPGELVPVKTKNTASEIVNRGFTTVNTEEGVYERNRGTGTMTRLGSNPRMMFAPGERYVPVADPNNPGIVTYQKAGIAAQQGLQSPQSAPVQAAKAVTKSAVAGKIGDEINAFNTAIAHADLLQQAAAALGNGDQQTLAGLKNRFKNEFGESGPVTAQAIADAYTREVTKMLSSGHMTDSEISSVGKTLDPNRQNLQTVQSVIGAYKALAQSKMQQRQNQVERGQKGEANFPTNEITATAPNGHKIAYRNGAWVDAATGQPVQ